MSVYKCVYACVHTHNYVNIYKYMVFDKYIYLMNKNKYDYNDYNDYNFYMKNNYVIDYIKLYLNISYIMIFITKHILNIWKEALVMAYYDMISCYIYKNSIYILFI